MQTHATPDLIKKYNVPAPRYTSYPPVPFWKNDVDSSNWHLAIKEAYNHFGEEEGISLYIHLPYCENLCTYCGCNKHITKNHSVEISYISSVMKEWENYVSLLPPNPKLSGIHLGGGTPTFFSPESLSTLIRHITRHVEVMPHAEFSFEGHPNNTTRDHLKALFEVGFTRVSYGIQDFDLNVQKAIHRIQPFEKVAEVTQIAREIGYDSINFDLIYGLPHQTQETIRNTFLGVQELRPDRIAFYSYAHVPEAFPAQRSFEKFLPLENEKRSLYETGRYLLSDMGYMEIGMDHFALPNDPLSLAKENKTLHRNFMGYTTKPSKILIGLGNSAISDVFFAYAQNEKKIESYKLRILEGKSPIVKGHMLTTEDIPLKQLILSLICNHEAEWPAGYSPFAREEWLISLSNFRAEGLLDFDAKGIVIREKGIAFIRNICMVFDPYLQRSKNVGFSKAI
ncbi:oxygen-independent coproporphyrinogen III oxidase [Lunatimonas salinarum]|uniref:oxygen-independent coproporphyrinogen III oxidase n=1 Tax=Lunatimonas salinarum TaxID=1774590 RepID=UPI001ADFDA89|nr:oxygen-independent coproporphyrinogen III oxidase [Lunatimonas salinarum]